MPGASSSSRQYDLIIIGGGMAGASLACALGMYQQSDSKTGSALRIAVIEAFELNTEAQPCYDDRSIALSYGSRCIFDNLGLWDSLHSFAEPIKTIHISDRGHFGITRLTAEQESVEALGYVVENRALGQSLYAVMETLENVDLFCPAGLTAVQQETSQVSVMLSTGKQKVTLTASLLVAADGNKSQVLQLLNIGSNRQDYKQSALITNITPGKAHDNIAYERFTPDGPLAFLPMTENRCSVVWTMPPEQADYLYAMDDKEFLQQLQEHFGYRLGRIRITGKRVVYPLFLQSASQMTQQRVAILGNAAHSVHPVAGQGFNLALRDIALLSELIVSAWNKRQDIGNDALLHQYAEKREQDIQRVYRFTDTLVKTFSNAFAPLAHLRSLGLIVVDLIPDLKHTMARQSMGLSKLNVQQTRLNRGQQL